MNKKPEDLRSARWFAPDDLRSMGHRSRAMQMGLSQDDWGGKPIIAIINTWSDLSPCHHHLRDRAEWVKRGVPLRLEVGPRDIEKDGVFMARRDTGQKAPTDRTELIASIGRLLGEIQDGLLERARELGDD